MVRIGCTGAIGSGKSTVAAILASKGAQVIDADDLARAAIAPGTPGYDAVVARFSERVLASDGSLDRAALARIVFADSRARRDLEEIVHPVVAAAITAELARPREAREVVVLDVALLVETDGRDRYDLDGVLVVDAPEELCVERLVANRAMTPEQARARLAAQTPRDRRLRAADFIILNIGTLGELEEMAAGAWDWITTLAREAEEQ